LLSPDSSDVLDTVATNAGSLSLTEESLKRIIYDDRTNTISIGGEGYLQTMKCFEELSKIVRQLSKSQIQNTTLVSVLETSYDTLDNIIMNELRQCALRMEEILFELLDTESESIASFKLNDDSKHDTSEQGIASDGSFLKSKSIRFRKTTNVHKWKLSRNEIHKYKLNYSGLRRLHYTYNQHRKLKWFETSQESTTRTAEGNGRNNQTQQLRTVHYSSLYFSEEDMNRRYASPPLTTFGYLYTGGKLLTELVAEAVQLATTPIGATSSSVPEMGLLEGEHMLLPESTRLLLRDRSPMSEPEEPPTRRRNSRVLVNIALSEQLEDAVAQVQNLQLSEAEDEAEEMGEISPEYLFITAEEESENVKKITTTEEGVREIQAFGDKLASNITTIVQNEKELEKRAVFLTNTLLQIRSTSEEDKKYLY